MSSASFVTAPGPPSVVSPNQPCAALFGLPTLDEFASSVAPRIEPKKRSCSSVLEAPKSSKAGKRRGAVFVPREPKRSPLDVFGDGALRTRDHFGHITASIKALMPLKTQKETGILESLDELATTVTKDMTRQIDLAWKNGVAHGEWLREGEGRRNAEVAASATKVKSDLFQLQIDYQSLVNQYTLALARIKELTPQVVNLDELQLDLADLLGEKLASQPPTPPSSLSEDDALRRALADITSIL